MEANVFVELEMSPSSGYISVGAVVGEEYLKEAYNEQLDRLKEYGWADKAEVFEGFKLRYVPLVVTYDGRKRRIDEEDVLQSLEKAGYAEKVGDSMFGGFYNPTDALTELLADHMERRKALRDAGKYVLLNEEVAK